jgi:hypothetical protein
MRGGLANLSVVRCWLSVVSGIAGMGLPAPTERRGCTVVKAKGPGTTGDGQLTTPNRQQSKIPLDKVEKNS